MVVIWHSGSMVVTISEVNLRRVVLGWVAVSGFISWCRPFISVCNQPPRSTQPGHPFMGRHKYQPKGGNTLRLGSKRRNGSCVGGRVFIPGRPFPRAPGNPGHFTFPNSREWSGLVPGENGNGAADVIAVI